MNSNNKSNKISILATVAGILALSVFSTGCAASFRGSARGTMYVETPSVYVDVPPPVTVVVTPAPLPPPVVFVPPPPPSFGGSVYVQVPPVTLYGGVQVDTTPHRRHPCDWGNCR